MDALNDLKNFHNQLTQYRTLLDDGSADRERIQTRRTELQRTYPRLKDVISRYSGEEITAAGTGTWDKVDIFEDALEPYSIFDSGDKSRRLYRCLTIINKAIGRLEGEEQSWKSRNQGRTFVEVSRIEELRAMKSARFGFERLVKLCEELNVCYENECYLAVAMLTRALQDHVPPIFGFDRFSQVANNHNGGKSFKELMQNLENSSRKIADAHLHTQIRNKEALPSRAQVDFLNAVDVLLSEVIRILK